jgi:hypothetical protein
MKIIIPDGQTTWLVTERVDPLILVVTEKLPGLSDRRLLEKKHPAETVHCPCGKYVWKG